jgi:hypothetical protein
VQRAPRATATTYHRPQLRSRVDPIRIQQRLRGFSFEPRQPMFEPFLVLAV